MTLEEARKACEEGLLCLLHLPKHGPYIPAEDIPVYITAMGDDFQHDFFGASPHKGEPYESSCYVRFVSAHRQSEYPAWLSGLQHIRDALSLAEQNN